MLVLWSRAPADRHESEPLGRPLQLGLQVTEVLADHIRDPKQESPSWAQATLRAIKDNNTSLQATALWVALL